MTAQLIAKRPTETETTGDQPLSAPSPIQSGGRAPWEIAARFDTGRDADATDLIMMVDDEPTTTEILQMFLESAGYGNFVTCNDAREAIAVLAERRPDVVLLDLMMPGVSGFEILATMREDENLRHIPAIMLTSSVDADTKLKALELGATDFLGKPVDPSELALRLRNTLRAKAHQDRLAYFDSLTGLPNRVLFERRLTRALNISDENHRYCAVLHFDINRFQKLNESLGHRLGDMVLKAVAQRLESSIMVEHHETLRRLPLDDPFIARLGGDEFMVVLPDLDHMSDIERVIEQIRANFAQPILAAKEELFISTSIGVALSPHDGTDAEVLMQKAGSATAYAKQKGSKQHQFFSSEINDRVSEHTRLEHQLHKAQERRELELQYQPKISLETGQVIGAEALLRWKHPELGYVSPGVFIPIAEETGLIVEIGNDIIRHACRQLLKWESHGYGHLTLAINVSAVQFRDPSFLEVIQAALRDSGVDGSHLTIELTESILMDNIAEASRTLERVRSLGPKISIDDFGTGYSSLGYLKRFAIDELKIDRSFLRDLPQDGDNRAIVDAIIGLAHGLHLSVVAEGVEDIGQHDYVRDAGCRDFQGFIASRALPASRFLEFVRASDDNGWAAAASSAAN